MVTRGGGPRHVLVPTSRVLSGSDPLHMGGKFRQRPREDEDGATTTVRFVNPLDLDAVNLDGEGGVGGPELEDQEQWTQDVALGGHGRRESVDSETEPDSPTVAEEDLSLFEAEEVHRHSRAVCSYMLFLVASVALLPVQTLATGFMLYVAILVKNSLTTLMFGVCASILVVMLLGLRAARRQNESHLRLFAFLTVLTITMQLSVVVVVELDTDGSLLTAFLKSVGTSANNLCGLPVDKLPLGIDRSDGTIFEQTCSCFAEATGSSDGLDMVGCLVQVADEHLRIKQEYIVAWMVGTVLVQVFLAKLAWGMMVDLDVKAFRKQERKKGGAPTGTLRGEIVSGEGLHSAAASRKKNQLSMRECTLGVYNPEVHNKQHRSQEVTTFGIEDDPDPNWHRTFDDITLYKSTRRIRLTVLDTVNKKKPVEVGRAEVDLGQNEFHELSLVDYDYVIQRRLSQSDEPVSIALKRVDPSTNGRHLCAAGMVKLRLAHVPAASVLVNQGAGVTKSWYFEATVLAMCALSLVVLAMQSPADPPSLTTAGTLRILEIFCAAHLLVETLLEMVARTSQTNAWWRDPWIGMSLFVLCCSWLSILNPPVVEQRVDQRIRKFLSFGRVFRILRPIRTLRMINDIDIIVTVLNDSSHLVLTVCGLLFFLLAVFCLIGMSSFSGALQYECIGDGTRPVVCSAEQQHEADHGVVGPMPCPIDCPHTLQCAADFDDDNRKFCAPLVRKRKVGYDLFGYRDFDSFLRGLMSMFVQTAGDGGMHVVPQALYEADAVAASTAWVISFAASILLSLISLNLFLAICCSTYSGVYVASLERRKARQRLMDEVAAAKFSQETAEQTTAREEHEAAVEAAAMIQTMTYEECVAHKRWGTDTKAAWLRNVLRVISIHDNFQHATSLLIIGNTVIMAMVYEGMPAGEKQLLGMIEAVFLTCFIVEAMVKWLGAGSTLYLSSNSNIFDLFVILASVAGFIATYFHELLASAMGMDATALGSLQGLRAVRLLRALQIVRLLQRQKALMVVLQTIFTAWKPISIHTAFSMFSISMFSVIGMHLFGGSLGAPCTRLVELELAEDECVTIHDYQVARPENFETFWVGCLTVFELTVGEDWSSSMYWYMKYAGEGFDYPPVAVMLFFAIMFIWMNCILFSLYVAMLLQNFAVAEDQKAVLQKRVYDRLQRAAKRQMRQLKQSLLINAVATEQMKGHSHEDDSSIYDQLMHAVAMGDLDNNNKKSLYLFRLDSLVRLKCAKIQESKRFGQVITILILFSCVSLALEGPQDAQSGFVAEYFGHIFEAINLLVLTAFSVEALLKVIVHGFYFESGPTRPYLQTKMNAMDFVIIVVCVLTYVPDMPIAGPWARALRLARVITPLLNLTTKPEIKIVVLSFIRAIPDAAVVLLPLVLMVLVFSIVGVEWFGGTLQGCIQIEQPFVQLHGMMDNRTLCEATPGYHWRPNVFSFDDSVSGMATIFTAIADGAHSLMLQTNTVGKAKSIGFWLSFQILFRCFFLNLFLGVLSASYEKSCGSALMTIGEKQWASTVCFVRRFRPTRKDDETMRPTPAASCCKCWKQPLWWFELRNKCFDLACDESLERVWRWGIVANTITLATDRYPINNIHQTAVEWLNLAFLCVCATEVVIKLIGFGFSHYFSNGWLISDFILVTVSIGLRFGGIKSGVEVLRVMRVFRMIVLASKLPALVALIDTIIKCLRASFAIVGITALIVYGFAVLGMQTFGLLPTDKFLLENMFATDQAGIDTLRKLDQGVLLDMACPSCEGFNSFTNMSNFAHTVKLLLQVTFGQSIGVLVREIHYLGGGFWPPFLYFLAFYVITVWVCINLLIVNVLSNFDSETTQPQGKRALTPADLDGFSHTWAALTVGVHASKATQSRETSALGKLRGSIADALPDVGRELLGDDGVEDALWLEEGDPLLCGELKIHVDTMDGVPCDTVRPYCIMTVSSSDANTKTRCYTNTGKTSDGVSTWKSPKTKKKDHGSLLTGLDPNLLCTNINGHHTHVTIDVFDSYKFSHTFLGTIRMDISELRKMEHGEKKACELRADKAVEIGKRSEGSKGRGIWNRFESPDTELLADGEDDEAEEVADDNLSPAARKKIERQVIKDHTKAVKAKNKKKKQIEKANRKRIAQIERNQKQLEKQKRKEERKRAKRLKKWRKLDHDFGDSEAELEHTDSDVDDVWTTGQSDLQEMEAVNQHASGASNVRDRSVPSGMVLNISVTYEAQMQELPALSFVEDHRTQFTHKEATNGTEGWLEVAKGDAWSGFKRRYCFLQVDPVPCFKYYEDAASVAELETKAFAYQLTTKTILAKDIITLAAHHDRHDHATKRKGVNFQIGFNEDTKSGKLVEAKIGQLVGSVVQATGLHATPTSSAGVRLLTEIKYGQEGHLRESAQTSQPEDDVEDEASETIAKITSAAEEEGMVPVDPSEAWYMTTKKVSIHVGSADDSAVCGQLQRYERVRVTHMKSVGKTLRLKTLRGWVDAKSLDGLSTTMLPEKSPNRFFRCKKAVSIEETISIASPVVGKLHKNYVIESLESTEDVNTGTVRHRIATGWVSEVDHQRQTTVDPYCVIEVAGVGEHKTEAVDDNLLPNWDSDFAFQVVSSSVKVKVSVWNENAGKHDGRGVPIGVAELELGADGIPGPTVSGIGLQPWVAPSKEEDGFVHGREGRMHANPNATVGIVNTKTREEIWEEQQAKLAESGAQTQTLTLEPRYISIQLFPPTSGAPQPAPKSKGRHSKRNKNQQGHSVSAANLQAGQAGTIVLKLGYNSICSQQYLVQKKSEGGGDLVAAMMVPETVEKTIRLRAMSPTIQRSWLGALRWLAAGSDPLHRPDDIPVPSVMPSELRRASNDISLLDLPFSRVPMLLRGLHMRKCMGSHKPTLRRLIYTVFDLETHARGTSVQNDRVSRKIAHQARASDPTGVYLHEIRGLNFQRTLERLSLLHYGKSKCLSYMRQMAEYEMELHSVSLHVMSAVISMWVFRKRFGKTVGGKQFPFHLAWQRFPEAYNIALTGVCAGRLRSLKVLLGEIKRHSKPVLADTILPRRARNSSPRKSNSPRNGANSPREESRCFKRKAKASKQENASVTVAEAQAAETEMSEAERRARYEEVFYAIDIDGGGTLDRDEVHIALEMMTGVKQTDAQLTSFMHLVDEDGNGEVDLEEWVHGMEHVHLTDTDADELMFHSDDEDSDLDELEKGVDELTESLVKFR